MDDYKETDFLRSIDNLIDDHSFSEVKPNTKMELDLKILKHFDENLQKLSTSVENKNILLSLKDNIQFCPQVVSAFIEMHNIKSFSYFFQYSFDTNNNAALLLEVISKIIEIDQKYSEYFSDSIFEIFSLIFQPDFVQLATSLTISIISNSKDASDKLVYEEAFQQMSNALNMHFPYMENLVCITKEITSKCRILHKGKNRFYLMELLHQLFFCCGTDLYPDMALCFKYLLCKTPMKPSIAIPKIIFERFLLEFSKLPNPAIEYYRFFNSILAADNRDTDESKDTFFLNYENIFSILIGKLQTKQMRVVIRLFANFSYIVQYAQIIIDQKLYFPIFELLQNESIPFSFKDDLCIFFCRILALSPDIFISLNYSTQNIFFVTDIVEAYHSNLLSNSFISFFESLFAYLSKTQISIDLDVPTILDRVSNIEDSNLAKWAAVKLSSQQF